MMTVQRPDFRLLISFFLLGVLLPIISTASECAPPDRFQTFVDRNADMEGPLSLQGVAANNMEDIIIDGESRSQPFGYANSIWQTIKQKKQDGGGELYALTFPANSGNDIASPAGVDGYALFQDQCLVDMLVMMQEGSVTLGGENASYERCVPLMAGQELHYEFKASQNLHFNLHYHDGGKTYYPVKEDNVESKKGFYVPENRGMYCVMWRNSAGASATVDIKLGVR